MIPFENSGKENFFLATFQKKQTLLDLGGLAVQSLVQVIQPATSGTDLLLLSHLNKKLFYNIIR